MSFSENPPAFVVAPYFFIESTRPSGWHSVNLDLARRSRAPAGDLPVFGVICCRADTLAREGKKLADDYSAIDLDGYLIWVDGFVGDESIGVLQTVRDFIKLLRMSERPVVSLFGGAASLVLAYSGLTGFCCGICYSERKIVDQDVDVEGAIPPSYYIESLKKKIRVETEAKRVRMNEFPDLACHCEICERKPDPATLDDSETREHFMLVRDGEISQIRGGLTATSFSGSLKNSYDKYKDEPLLSPVSHLLTWSRLLES